AGDGFGGDGLHHPGGPGEEAGSDELAAGQVGLEPGDLVRDPGRDQAGQLVRGDRGALGGSSLLGTAGRGRQHTRADQPEEPAASRRIRHGSLPFSEWGLALTISWY